MRHSQPRIVPEKKITTCSFAGICLVRKQFMMPENTTVTKPRTTHVVKAAVTISAGDHFALRSLFPTVCSNESVQTENPM